MIELYLVRHGIAADGDPGAPDAFRELTGKGRRRLQRTAKAFARLGRKLDLILTSPLVRAVQTAEILAGAAAPDEVGVLEELDPKVEVAPLLEALAKRVRGSKAVALVGHEPQVSALLSALSGFPQKELDVKKGAIVRIDVAALPQPKSVAPRWWLKPRAGSRIKGLPLRQTEETAKGAEAPARRKSRAAASSASRRRKRAAKPRPRRAPAAPAAAEAAGERSTQPQERQTFMGSPRPAAPGAAPPPSPGAS